MGVNIRGRNFLKLEDFTPEEIRYLLDLAHHLKAEKRAGVDQRRLIGKNLLMLFDLGSTRTRCSFETSAFDLGMGSSYLSNSHFGSKETIKDSIRVFNGLYDVAMYRGADHNILLEMAKDAKIPLINGLTDFEHPTQMLADAMTLEELWGKGSLKGKTFCYVGRTGVCAAYSYAILSAMMGMNFKLVTPFRTFEEARELLTDKENQALTEYMEAGGTVHAGFSKFPEHRAQVIKDLFAKYFPDCTFEETEDLDAVKGADIISTENFGYFTEPAVTWLPGVRNYYDYRVDRNLMKRTGNPNVVFIHQLPATHNADHSSAMEIVKGIEDPEIAEFLKQGFEVTDEVFEDYADVIFREAENRQHTIKAVILAVTGA